MLQHPLHILSFDSLHGMIALLFVFYYLSLQLIHVLHNLQSVARSAYPEGLWYSPLIVIRRNYWLIDA